MDCGPAAFPFGNDGREPLEREAGARIQLAHLLLGGCLEHAEERLVPGTIVERTYRTRSPSRSITPAVARICAAHCLNVSTVSPGR